MCLLHRSVSGERYVHLSFFARNHGLLRVLARQPNGRAALAIPDVFSISEVHASTSTPSKPFFLKDAALSRHFPELAHNYTALQCAATIAAFLRNNLSHCEDFGPPWKLLNSALEALATKPLPQATLLKFCFAFANAEGFPASALWLQQLPPRLHSHARRVLLSPLDQLATAPPTTALLIELLSVFARFLHSETPIELQADWLFSSQSAGR